MARVPWMISSVCVLAACGGGQVPVSGGPAPAPSAREAVVQFMQAVADSNLDAMASMWGTGRGPAMVTNQPVTWRQQIQVMHAYLRNTGNRIIAEIDGPNNRRIVTLEMDRPGCKKQVPFTLVPYRGGWLILAVDLNAAGAPMKPCGPGSLTQ